MRRVKTCKCSSRLKWIPENSYFKVIKTQMKKATPSPEELVKTFFELVEPSEPCIGYATLPYIKGITESLSRTLRKPQHKSL